MAFVLISSLWLGICMYCFRPCWWRERKIVNAVKLHTGLLLNPVGGFSFGYVKFNWMCKTDMTERWIRARWHEKFVVLLNSFSVGLFRITCLLEIGSVESVILLHCIIGMVWDSAFAYSGNSLRLLIWSNISSHLNPFRVAYKYMSDRHPALNIFQWWDDGQICSSQL